MCAIPPDLLLLHTVDVTERTRALEQVRQHVARLSALRRIDTAITASLDPRLTLDVVLAQVCTELAVDAAQVLVLNRRTLILESVASRGFQGACPRPTCSCAWARATPGVPRLNGACSPRPT